MASWFLNHKTGGNPRARSPKEIRVQHTHRKMILEVNKRDNLNEKEGLKTAHGRYLSEGEREGKCETLMGSRLH